MFIRLATLEDWDAIWPIFHQIVQTGDTYGYEPATTRDTARKLWLEQPQQTFVCEADGLVEGTYYIKTNHAGPGSHVCNCGYMVSASARGRGLASAMCRHSQQIALQLGYKAMQYNLVASSNSGAIHLWKKHGFSEVGRLPGAFNHPEHGYVDALVMFKWLDKNDAYHASTS